MKTIFSQIVSQLPDDVADIIENEADRRAAAISFGDPYNELGMAEAESIAQSITDVIKGGTFKGIIFDLNNTSYLIKFSKNTVIEQIDSEVEEEIEDMDIELPEEDYEN